MLKDGRWVGQCLVYLPSGPKYRYIYAETRKEAAEKLTKAMRDRNGEIVFDENLTVSDFLSIWLSDCVKDTIRISTFEQGNRGATRLPGARKAAVEGVDAGSRARLL